ncbi:NusG domain II-containing protein [Desulfopila sp. IMCC35008]|uniref:NusG domain II-containing protein n=1 Tax=Desulfopila sp. IMCC35008 TaxID=2653858 RepID=UPI0013D64599|nr:NusG domain II-containing protein [Desulfopila sp. IMCC35008]
MWKRIVKPFDVVITIMVCIAITVISFRVYTVDGQPVAVSIQSESGLSIYPLNQPQRLEVEGPQGLTVVEIVNKQARVVSSPCRDKLCIIKGVLKKNGDWTACMPNRIYVGIEGGKEEELDELSY